MYQKWVPTGLAFGTRNAAALNGGGVGEGWWAGAARGVPEERLLPLRLLVAGTQRWAGSASAGRFSAHQGTRGPCLLCTRESRAETARPVTGARLARGCVRGAELSPGRLSSASFLGAR